MTNFEELLLNKHKELCAESGRLKAENEHLKKQLYARGVNTANGDNNTVKQTKRIYSA